MNGINNLNDELDRNSYNSYQSEEEVIPIEPNYFDRRVEEEDEPIEVEDETQIKYRILDDIFEEFFEDDFLYMAKVL